MVWSAWDGAEADVFAARLVDGRVEGLEQISAGPGPHLAPCAAGGPDGSLWVAWQARRGRHFDVLARRRQAGGFGPEILGQRRSRERHPAGARNRARRGRMGRLDLLAGRALRGRQLRDLRQTPGSALGSASGLDFSPQRHAAGLRAASGGPRAGLDRVELPAGRRSRTSLPSPTTNGATRAIGWRGSRATGSERRRRSGSTRDRPTGSTVSVQAVPLRGASGDDVWLLFGDRVAPDPFAFDSRWELRLARTSPDSVSAAADLSAGVSSLVARYAGAWSGDALWVVDEIEQRFPAETGPLRSALRVRRMAPDQLPARVPPPPLPRRPRRPVNPTLALDRAPGERATVQFDGITWRAYFGNLHLHSDFSGRPARLRGPSRGQPPGAGGSSPPRFRRALGPRRDHASGGLVGHAQAHSNLKTIDEKMIDKKLTLTFNGNDLNLKPGQILLFIDSEKENNLDDNSWDFRIVKSSNPDFVNNVTNVELDDKSGRNKFIMQSGKLEANVTLLVYAFYLKGGLFGHNAPDWNALSPEVKKVYPGVDSSNVPEQWPLFSIEEWYHKVSLASKKPDGHGLFAEYYEDVELKNLKLAKIDPYIDSSKPFQEISKWLQENKPFSVRWTGRLLGTKSGKYYLIVVKSPEDGVKLWIDGKIVIDDWSHPSSQYKYAIMTLIKNSTYDLKLEYYHPEMTPIKNTHDLKLEYNHPEHNAVIQLRLVPFNKINNLKQKYQHDREDSIIEGIKSQTKENNIVLENNLLRPVPGIYIDPYDPEIFADSWILTITPDMQEIFKVGNAIEHICNGFMISCQTSLVTIKQTYNTDNIFKFNDRLRDTIGYARSKSLELADDPVVDEIFDSIDIEGSDWDFDSGHEFLISGTDKNGNVRSEHVTLKDISRIDNGKNTKLTFNEILQPSYKREGLTVFANVVQATHGETVDDILGSGDSSKANQRFRLKKSPLTYIHAATPSGSRSELEVHIDGVLWGGTTFPVRCKAY